MKKTRGISSSDKPLRPSCRARRNRPRGTIDLARGRAVVVSRTEKKKKPSMTGRRTGSGHRWMCAKARPSAAQAFRFGWSPSRPSQLRRASVRARNAGTAACRFKEALCQGARNAGPGRRALSFFVARSGRELVAQENVRGGWTRCPNRNNCSGPNRLTPTASRYTCVSGERNGKENCVFHRTLPPPRSVENSEKNGRLC